MRLIDADEMILDLQHRCSNETFYKQVKESLIDCAPTVDAVPVVRCKNCKHLYEVGGQLFCRYWTDQWDMPTELDGFCHAGEEKKNE